MYLLRGALMKTIQLAILERFKRLEFSWTVFCAMCVVRYLILLSSLALCGGLPILGTYIHGAFNIHPGM